MRFCGDKEVWHCFLGISLFLQMSAICRFKHIVLSNANPKLQHTSPSELTCTVFEAVVEGKL